MAQVKDVTWDFNDGAERLIIDGRFTEARELLESAIGEMPPGWTPVQGSQVAFWNVEEFLAYPKAALPTSEPLIWSRQSYSRAWCQLAVIASEQQQFDQALFCLDAGLQLEPDHPELWSEKGYALARLGRHTEALECYTRAATVRDWAPAAYKARSFRGAGVALVDLGRLDEAEARITQSLEYEPENENARNELGFIRQKRSQSEGAKSRMPFFLRSISDPPYDPLTRELISLVEDLPAIPGPQTVGPDNYSRIADAFKKRGWAGFEEEFDRVVPRHWPDYATVKRDMLREPLFNVKAHIRMAKVFSGEITVDEMFEEIDRSRDRKGQ